MQGEDIHINLWLTKQKIIIGLVVCFRLFDVMVPGVFFFFLSACASGLSPSSSSGSSVFPMVNGCRNDNG